MGCVGSIDDFEEGELNVRAETALKMVKHAPPRNRERIVGHENDTSLRATRTSVVPTRIVVDQFTKCSSKVTKRVDALTSTGAAHGGSCMPEVGTKLTKSIAKRRLGHNECGVEINQTFSPFLAIRLSHLTVFRHPLGGAAREGAIALHGFIIIITASALCHFARTITQ
jgi:hypothetical protein